MSTLFAERVKEIVKDIPAGQTLSYSAVAEAAGYPRAARAVASVMSKNYDSAVPCHRVICADGSFGGYNRGGEEKKRNLLIQEGAVL